MNKSMKTNLIKVYATSAHEPLMEVAPEQFLQVAYQRLLGRELDGVGARHYFSMLGRGISRAEVIANIVASSEFKERGKQLFDPGIEHYVWWAQRFRKAPLFWLRRPIANLFGLVNQHDTHADWASILHKFEHPSASPQETTSEIFQEVAMDELQICGLSSEEHHASSTESSTECANGDVEVTINAVRLTADNKRNDIPLSSLEWFVNVLDQDPLVSPHLPDAVPRQMNLKAARLQMSIKGKSCCYFQVAGPKQWVDNFNPTWNDFHATTREIWATTAHSLREFLLVPCGEEKQTTPEVVNNIGDGESIFLELRDETREILYCASYSSFAIVHTNHMIDLHLGGTFLTEVNEVNARENGFGFGESGLVHLDNSYRLWWGPIRVNINDYIRYNNQRFNISVSDNAEEDMVLTLQVDTRPEIHSLLAKLNRLGDEDFIRSLYRQILHRNADEEGLQSVLTAFRRNIARLGVARAIVDIWDSFVESDEFQRIPLKFIETELYD